jgi:MTH538 TIR-like domain (DUF1863)
MNVVFFSYTEDDREYVLLVKGRAVNPAYYQLSFRVQDLLARWNTSDPAVIRQAISKSLDGTSRTIVFVGTSTWQSRWVAEEVEMTLAAGKPVYAIGLPNGFGLTPSCLTSNNIIVYGWSEANLQALATQ